MLILIGGICLFFLVHLVPSAPAFRQSLVNRMGANGYKGLFSLLALAGFVLLIWGKASADFVPVWNPPEIGRTVAPVLMLFAFISMAAMGLPSNLTRFTRHPMLWGVTLWSLAHLLANGDLASILLFGSFGVFALFDMWSANVRGATKSGAIQPLWRDFLLLVIGVLLYLVFLIAHPHLFGVNVIGSI